MITLALWSCLALTPPSFAGSQFQTAVVAADAVPAEVVSAHTTAHGAASTTWKKNTWTSDQGQPVTVYVAWFTNPIVHRAAYKPTGEGYLTIAYLGGAKNLPQPIQDALLAQHPGYRITAAQRYDASGMHAFRTELRQGTTKVVHWTDAQGQEISKDNLPDGAEQLGG